MVQTEYHVMYSRRSRARGNNANQNNNYRKYDLPRARSTVYRAPNDSPVITAWVLADFLPFFLFTFFNQRAGLPTRSLSSAVIVFFFCRNYFTRKPVAVVTERHSKPSACVAPGRRTDIVEM